MRNIIILFFVFLTAGCKTYSYFGSANNVLNESCRIMLSGGTEISGKITVQFETGQSADRYLKIQTGTGAEKKVLVTDITYYKYKNDYFFPKEVNLQAYEIPLRDKIYTPNVSNILFMKRLTGDTAKLQLFELFKSGNNSPDGIEQHDYYISFPNESRFAAWNVRSNKFFPGFEEKMGKIVAGCPALAAKIEQKENGYTIRQISVDAKKNAVIKKIVEEYNDCK